jgi:hypothetical protein
MIFNLKADPYQTDVLFCIDATQNQIDDHLRRVLKSKPEFIAHVKEQLAGMKEGRCLHFDNGAIMIVLRDRVVSALTMGLLVHEVHHAVCFILRRAGLPQNEDTEEAYAYLNQHLCERAFRRIGSKWWK